MDDICDREVLLNQNGRWIALEGDYWIALLRLLRAYGLDSGIYAPPLPGGRNYVNEDAARELVNCLKNATSDVPCEDLWPYHRSEPSPLVVPPLEYFSGVGMTYLETLIRFVGTEGFFVEVTAPGTEYCFLGELPCRPGS